MTPQAKKSVRRKFVGTVVADAMKKTVVVKVDRMKEHPKYRKYFIESKRYKVHDENKEFRVGDVVEFEECRPISKEKRWRVIKKVKGVNE